MRALTRQELILGLASWSGLLGAAAGCRAGDGRADASGGGGPSGRLSARIGRPTSPGPGRSDAPTPVPVAPGGLLRLPRDHKADLPAPLLVMLHGSGGKAANSLTMVAAEADLHGFIVLAPQSQAGTWDLIRGGFGADLAALDRALAWVSERYPIAGGSVAIGGFSDGASYALSVGVTNGQLFQDILAFSPGFALPGPPSGKPRIYISHGRADRVLPFDRCGAALYDRFRQGGYDVRLDPFEGGHTVPADKLRAAVARWLGPRRRG